MPVPILFRSIESGPCPFGRGFTHRAVHGEMHRIDVQNGGFGGILINVGKHQTLIFHRCKIFTVRGIDLGFFFIEKINMHVYRCYIWRKIGRSFGGGSKNKIVFSYPNAIPLFQRQSGLVFTDLPDHTLG